MVTLSGQWCTVAVVYPLLAHHNTVEYTVSEVVQAGHGNIHLAAKNKPFCEDASEVDRKLVIFPAH